MLKKSKSSALILPPEVPGSLGDEAMLIACVDYLKEQGIKKIGLVSYDPSLRWKHLSHIDETVEMSQYLRNGSQKALVKFVKAVSGYERFYCLGADMMDGYYSDKATLRMLKLVSLSAKVGAHATILGFSFNKKPTPSSIQALRDLPKDVTLCARDPVSQKRLIHHVKRPIKLVADVAFLLQPFCNSKPVLKICKWIRKQKAKGRIVIGVNANFSNVNKLKYKAIEMLTQVYIDTLSYLYSKDKKFSFVFIPHDSRYKNSDVILAKSILKAISSKMLSSCIKTPLSLSPSEIRCVCKEIDVCLSGRMHLAISCLSQGTPVACITYQGKFEGLFKKHFKLDGMTIEPEQTLQPKKLVKFLIPIIMRRKKIQKKIKLRLPHIVELAKKNFSNKTFK